MRKRATSNVSTFTAAHSSKKQHTFMMMMNNNWQRQKFLLGIGLASLFITSSSSSSSSLGIERCDSEKSISSTINSLPFPTLVRLTEMTVPFSNSSSNSNWTLHRGENYSLKADFQSVSAARQVHLRLYLLPVEGGTLSSIRLPFFRKDLCRTPGTDLHCPLLPSHSSSFKLTVRIPAQTPPLQGRLRLLLLNERRRPLLCFIMPLRVAADDS